MHKRKDFQLDKLSLKISHSSTNLGQLERVRSKRFTFIQKSQSNVSSPSSPMGSANCEDRSESIDQKSDFNNNLVIEPIKCYCEEELYEEEDSLVRDLIGIMDQNASPFKEKKQAAKKLSRVSKQDIRAEKPNVLIETPPIFKIRTKVLSPRVTNRKSNLKQENEKVWNLVH
ncbi:unnamed protein product [Blepharisma stoltei]|uniref:Uncharacterized protein n=1 Tax=Blepharisma stoltei TaxID=1481888 RepID=A0AAU9J9F1_9CILI|nr:unnamed protein product [Blepharisma stoltei]